MLSIIAGIDRKPTSILNTGAPAPAAPGLPAPPLGSGAGGVLDVLKQQGLQPGAPQQPPRSGARGARRRRRPAVTTSRQQGPGNRPFEFVGIAIRKRGDGPLVESNRAV